MLSNKKNGTVKKLAAMGLVLVMAVGLGVSAFASGQPGSGGNMGGMNAGQIGMTENASSGDMGEPVRNVNSQMPAQDNTQQPDDRLSVETEQSDTAPAAEPKGTADENVAAKPENVLQPDNVEVSSVPGSEDTAPVDEPKDAADENVAAKPENVLQPDNVEVSSAPGSKDTAPADEPKDAADENVAAKPENDLQLDNEEISGVPGSEATAPADEPKEAVDENVATKPDNAEASGEPASEKMTDDGEIKANGIDIKAVESYIQTAGDNADENVMTAYKALAEALAAAPDEADEEDRIAGLESALADALLNANIDLGQYEPMPEQANAPSGEPADESFSGASGEPAGAASGEMQNNPESGSEGQRENGSESSNESPEFYTVIRMFLDRFISFLRNL